MELQVKVLQEVSFKDKLSLAIAAPAMCVVMYKERTLQNFDMSPLYHVDDDLINLINQMCPTIQSFNLQGNNLDLSLNQRFSDILLPFKFITSLRLSQCAAVDTLEFLLQAPHTLKILELDSLFIPACEFTKFLPALSNQLVHLSITRNPQLKKYDLVNILQWFWKLTELNIVRTDYLTPGTCATISQFCYNLETFFFSQTFQMTDRKAWIDVLGQDLQHIAITDECNKCLQRYREIEQYYANGENYDELDD